MLVMLAMLASDQRDHDEHPEVYASQAQPVYWAMVF